MIPEIITSYNEFLEATQKIKGVASLFWVVEYSPQELGFSNETDVGYANSTQRFTLVRNECAIHPNDFVERLNQHLYRIWTITPYMNTPW